jgi:hypothetical protein
MSTRILLGALRSQHARLMKFFVHVRRKGATPLIGAEEQTARAINACAQYACLLSLQMRSTNKTKLVLAYR